jgi:hypothetical protein
MGKLLTTVLLCAASMIGAAMIGSQGFGPDPLLDEEDAALSADCESIADEQARIDCVALKSRTTSRQ